MNMYKHHITAQPTQYQKAKMKTMYVIIDDTYH